MEYKKNGHFVFLGIILLMFITVILKTNSLKKNNTTITCTITSVRLSAKNGKFIIGAEFIVNNKIQTLSTQMSCSDYKLYDLSIKLVGKSVIALYEPNNPSNNILLLEEKMFNSFHINMPDSLRWIDSIATCK